MEFTPISEARHSFSSIKSHIIENYWGKYCAILSSKDSDYVCVLPEPTGTEDVFYCKASSGTYVSNSLEWVISMGGAKFGVRHGNLLDTAYGIGRYGDGTVIKGIYRIPFGHALKIWPDGRTEYTRVWPHTSNNRHMEPSEVAEKLNSITQDVLRSLGDPKTGIFLSGGRDSSLLSAIYAQANSDLPDPIKFVHCETENKNGDEKKYARYVSEKLNGELSIMSETEYLSGFGTLWSDQRGSVNDIQQSLIDIAKEKMSCISFIDGKIGDSIFIDEVHAGYLSEMATRDILSMSIPSTLLSLLNAKIYSRLFTQNYLTKKLDGTFASFRNCGVLTPKAMAMTDQANNLMQFKRDVSLYSNNTSVSKATYIMVTLRQARVTFL